MRVPTTLGPVGLGTVAVEAAPSAVNAALGMVDFSIPDNDNSCGLPPPSSLMDTEPWNVPVTALVKWTVMVQDPEALKTDGQLLVSEKAPEMVMLLIVRGVVPVFVSVDDFGDGGQVWDETTHENARLAGLS